ncbi:MAG: Ig-like domain-containing protein, partial [Pyrinomonadaceae bacterium]
ITGQTIVVDKTAPSTTSFARFNPATSPTNADTLVFQATFSENVINVDAADFAVTGTTATVTGVVGVGGGPDFSVYNVTVSGGDLAGLNGTVGLNFSGALNITDLATNPLPNVEPATDQTYVVDNTPPTVNIVDVAPDPRNTAVASIAINFSEDVSGFDIADLTLTRDAGANLLPGGASITGGAQNYTLGTTTAVTTPDGAYVLTLAAPGGITDAAGNALVIGDTDSWVMDAAAPTVTINQSVGQNDPTFVNPINFTATFNEPVTDFDDVTDVVITGTAAGVGTATKVITPVSTTVYTIAVSGITGDGTVIANIPAGVAIDAATNPNVAGTFTDNQVTFVTCVPPPANMLAWYTGDGTPRDIAGGIDGTLVNGATYGAGKVGQAFDFDGVNDVVTAPGNGALNITGNQMSQDAWVYPRTHVNGGFIVGKSATSDHPYVMYNVG